MMRTIEKIILLGTVTLLAACAPGLGKTLDVSYQPVTEARGEIANLLLDVRYRLGQFRDQRQHAQIGEIDGRKILPEGDLSAVARDAVQSALRDAGALPSLYSGKVIEGELRNLYFRVTPNFPLTSLEAVTTIKLSVLDKDGQPVYAAQYSGTVERKHPLMDEAFIKQAISAAFDTAALEAVKDEGLIGALQAVRSL